MVEQVERSQRYMEGVTRILSPRPPIGAKRPQKQNSGPDGENSESSESVSPNYFYYFSSFTHMLTLAN